jgi:hypothetical protein
VACTDDAEVFAADIERLALEQIDAGERLSARGTLAADGSLLARSAFLGPTFRRRGIVREVRPAAGGGYRLILDDEEARGRFELAASPRAFVSRRRTGPAELLAAQPGELAVITALPAGSGLPPTAVRIDLEPARSAAATAR